MNLSSISAQLQNDYPDYSILLDSENRMIVLGNHQMSLLNSTSSLENMNIFSRSGKSFYQAIVQLIYSNFNILPQSGSYAASLVIRREDVNKYKLQKLAKEWGIGFLENNEDILALEIEDGIERDLFLESEDRDDEPDIFEENEWAELEEIAFKTEIAYLEKGLEFMTELEKQEVHPNSVYKKNEETERNIQHKQSDDEINPISHGILNYIKKMFNR